MSAPGKVHFYCRDCGRGVQVGSWSRYAAARRCPRCFRATAYGLADQMLEAARRRQLAEPPPEPPSW
jgi:hypothetical protein